MSRGTLRKWPACHEFDYETTQEDADQIRKLDHLAPNILLLKHGGKGLLAHNLEQKAALVKLGAQPLNSDRCSTRHDNHVYLRWISDTATPRTDLRDPRDLRDPLSSSSIVQ